MKVFNIILFVLILLGGIWFIAMNSQRGVATLPVVTPTPAHQVDVVMTEKEETENAMMTESDQDKPVMEESKAMEEKESIETNETAEEREPLELLEFEPQDFESIEAIP